MPTPQIKGAFMKKFLAIALFCAPFASTICAEVLTMNENAEPGLVKIFVKMPNGHEVRVAAPCKQGDIIQYARIMGSDNAVMNIGCGAVGKMG